ncbi:MAG: hypothetical protein DCF25_05140 [Leptolyngbya foveolarum]|uniref:Uncharacterized protein n=1 Tax=Leptolyngbya foveolarum TaxID=47253 RepID=A0A2W4UPS1_9CYAN|nr:MAG: hypothetical protein DCF25_05140 [Leptolyngbya foveolarum]
MAPANELSAYYRQLHLQTGATSQTVDEAYFKLRAQKIRENARQDLAALKIARDQIKAHLQTIGHQSAIASDVSPSADSEMTPIAALGTALKQLGLTTQIRLQEKTLHVGIRVDAATDPGVIKGQVYQFLSGENLGTYGLDAVETVRLYGLDKNSKTSRQVIWKKAFPLPRLHLTEADAQGKRIL